MSIRWDQVHAKLWTSGLGYVEEINGSWTAFVYRNVMSGKAWTESRPGFGNAQSARAWVERNAEY